MRASCADVTQAAAASMTASAPRTLSSVSYWPANDASGRSSARPDDRTANGPSPSRASAAAISLRVRLDSGRNHEAVGYIEPEIAQHRERRGFVPASTGVSGSIEYEKSGHGRDPSFGGGVSHWRLLVNEKTVAWWCAWRWRHRAAYGWPRCRLRPPRRWTVRTARSADASPSSRRTSG